MMDVRCKSAREGQMRSDYVDDLLNETKGPIEVLLEKACCKGSGVGEHPVSYIKMDKGGRGFCLYCHQEFRYVHNSGSPF